MTRHLQADCQEPGSAAEPYARYSSTCYLYGTCDLHLFHQLLCMCCGFLCLYTSQCTFTTTHVLYHGHQWCVVYKHIYTTRQKKGTSCLLWINLLIMQRNLTPAVLLLKNIAIDVTSLISGIYTTFHTFLCKKCDVGYYVYQSSNEIDVFIVSVSLLHNS